MSRVIDITGQKYGRLMVLSREPNTKSGQARWKCKCECGQEVIVTSTTLRFGITKSCGCYKREQRIISNTTHGRADTAEYKIWQFMKNRCLNTKNQKYNDYGGRGITVCERWMNSFENFLIDMGSRPSPKHSIDRIDNNGNYEPGNCKWSTQLEQIHNQRIRKSSTTGINGVTKVRNKWRSMYFIGKKRIHLGYFTELEQAIEARNQAEIKYRERESS